MKKKLQIILVTLLFIASIACKKEKTENNTETLQQEQTQTSKEQKNIVGEINTNASWTNDKIYVLNGFVYVTNGATLTIQAGTIIKGDKATMGTLIVERGAKLIAEGSSTNPIVFTSNENVGNRNYGDWGGLIICGKASVNLPGGEGQIEGGPRSFYGGGATPNDEDNSGILKYIRIEYAGYPFQPNKEINGLTLGGVGRGTTIDYVQVSFCNDDAFEWFGGTVNCKHLISYKNLDDDFDTDNGFVGNVQFGVVLRDSSKADQSGSNAFESDNDATGSGNLPITAAKFCNISVFGPMASENNNYNPLFKRAMHLRRNTKLSIYNSILVGYPIGILIDGSSSETNANNNELQIENCMVAGSKANAFFAVNTGSTFDIRRWFKNPAKNNDTLASNSLMNIPNAFDYLNPSFIPAANSVIYQNASFNNARLNVFTNVSYIGAFDGNNWTLGWTNFNPQVLNY